MSQPLEGLKYDPLWTSHLGCIKGCLRYLGKEISESNFACLHLVILGLSGCFGEPPVLAWRSDFTHGKWSGSDVGGRYFRQHE